MVEQVFKSVDTLRADRVPPGQRATEEWPVLHYGATPQIRPEQWTLSLTGLVEPQLKLSYREFLALPMARVFSDIHCVTTWSKLGNTWDGVLTSTVAGLTRVLPQARFVMVRSAGDYYTNLELDDFLQPDVLLATGHNGKPLTPEHGFPVRLVVPRLYFWKSAKWVTGIEFMDRERLGFWESLGYHRRGDPWKEERYQAGAEVHIRPRPAAGT
ncbi:MAG: sulfite oxidase-like oxidoreductase [Chloroflexi bacterium]|nr:sulfite oxidase-like oxidoreductase [Chloroflexota bacterium]